MCRGLYVVHDLLDVPVRIDHEGRAADTLVLLSEVRLLTPDAVLLGDRMIRVGEEGKREAVLVFELHMGAFVIGRDPEYDRSRALKLAVRVANAAGLLRATRRVVLGVEVENDRLAAEPGERDGFAAVAPELEVRSRL